MKKISILALLIFSSIFCITAQTAKMPDIGITATLALGEVTAMNAEAKNLVLKTRDGDITVELSDATKFQKANPANPGDLASATAATLADIGVGDRLVASGKIAPDKKSMVSRTVILMTKSDISKHQQAESEAWTKGINGKVVAIEPVKKEITVSMRSLMGERTVVLNDTSNVKFRRYAPNSVKFSDAVSGSFADIKTGDQIRARGTRSDDGMRFTAEEVISGSFRTVGGKITAIDTAKNEVTIDDVITKKAVTIALNDTTVLKKFTAEQAQQAANMQAMAAAGGMRMGQGGAPNGQGAQGGSATGQPAGQAGGQPLTTGTPQAGGPRQGGPGQGGQGGPGGMRMGGGGRGGDLDSMLERLPAIALADLKVGDAIAVSSTAGQDPNKLTAIKLLAGVEPFLTAPQLSLPQGGGRGQQSPSINIPGLDGIGGN